MVLDLIWVADTARIVVGFTLQKGAVASKGDNQSTKKPMSSQGFLLPDCG